jgi:hypothetical protein
MRDIELTVVHLIAAPAEACTRMERATPPCGEPTNGVVVQGVDIVDGTLDDVVKGNGRQPPCITPSCVLAR